MRDAMSEALRLTPHPPGVDPVQAGETPIWLGVLALGSKEVIAFRNMSRLLCSPFCNLGLNEYSKR